MAPQGWYAVTYGLQLDALTIHCQIHYQTYDICAQASPEIDQEKNLIENIRTYII